MERPRDTGDAYGSAGHRALMGTRIIERRGVIVTISKNRYTEASRRKASASAATSSILRRCRAPHARPPIARLGRARKLGKGLRCPSKSLLRQCALLRVNANGYFCAPCDLSLVPVRGDFRISESIFLPNPVRVSRGATQNQSIAAEKDVVPTIEIRRSVAKGRWWRLANKDWLVEGSEFEPPVPVSELSETASC